MTDHAPSDPTPTDSRPATTRATRRRPLTRRVLAVTAGVLAVPSLYAVASAATGGGVVPSLSSSSTSSAAAHDSTGTETELEHGVLVTKPHGGGGADDTAPTVAPTVPTEAPVTAPVTTPGTETELEHGVLVTKPHDEDDADDDRGAPTAPAPAPVAPITQAFVSAGGSIQVTLADSAVSLTSSTPAAGFTVEVHDNGPGRVEVRFFSGGTEWRIRVEPAGGSMVSEISQHG